MPEDLGEKTEEPTQKRREDARRRGNVPRSQELGSAVMLLAATLLVAAVLVPALGRFRAVVEAVLSGRTLGDPLAASEAPKVIEYVGAAGARIALPVLLITAAVAFIGQFLQIGWLFAPTAAQPRLNNISPLSGARRIFGITGLFRAGLAVVKVAVMAAVVVLTLHQYRHEIATLCYLDLMPCLARSGLILLDLALRLLAVLLLLGVVDLLYQRWKHHQDLKMTKQEVKDEMKQSEGDPDVKRRRLRMQQEITMQRIRSAVPTADVVVTNPEHISVAVRYEADRMNAPKVVAKGADFVALRIRQLALASGVPIVERPPLARALFRQVPAGGEIPPDLYHAVAEVLAYVYRLGAAGGGAA